MERISENIKTIKIEGFVPTGNLSVDAIELAKFNGRDTEKLPMGIDIILSLRLMLGIPLIMHQVTEAVCKKVQHTRIESLPSIYPDFLSKPFLIESKPGKYLFDDIDAIGGFIDESDEFFLVIWSKQGTLFSRSKNPFIGIKLDRLGFNLIPGSFVPPANQNKNVLPFITVLALMLEAEKSPVVIDHGSKKASKRNFMNRKNNNTADWVEKRIYIDAKLSYKSDKTAKDTNTTIPLDKSDKEKQTVSVHGFLRHQAHGPGYSERKWIYIEDHKSSRWKKPGDRKITVDAYFKDPEIKIESQ